MPRSNISVRLPNFIIFFFGLVSSAVVLFLVGLCNVSGFNIMGFYLVVIIPVGAIGVGLASGSGYALGSRLTNVKIPPWLIFVIFLMGMMTYILSHYVTYIVLALRADLIPTLDGFVYYIRDLCENSTFSFRSRGGRPDANPTRLGYFGYIFQVLEMIGFALGGIFPTIFLSAIPYCDHCQRYMRKEATRYLPSGFEKKQLKQCKGKNEKLSFLETAILDATQQFSKHWQEIQTLDFADVEDRLEEMESKVPNKTAAYVAVTYYCCSVCERWHLQANLTNDTLNRQPNTTLIHDSTKLAALPMPAREVINEEPAAPTIKGEREVLDVLPVDAIQKPPPIPGQIKE